jgi:hypothetical protein
LFLDKENELFESIIYKFCIDNSLDPNIVDIQEMFTKAHVPSYVEANNSITDVLKKSMVTNPQLRTDIYVHVSPSVNN